MTLIQKHVFYFTFLYNKVKNDAIIGGRGSKKFSEKYVIAYKTQLFIKDLCHNWDPTFDINFYPLGPTMCLTHIFKRQQ